MVNSRNKKRFVVDVVLFFSVFLFPWWATLIGAVLATFSFDSYFEGLVVGILLDALYGVPARSFIWDFPLTLLFSFLLLISFWAKDHFIFANRD